jgi:hypothetical protein
VHKPSHVEIARPGWHINGMLPECVERHDFKRTFVRRGQNNECGCSVIMSPEPVTGSDAPAVTGRQPRKAVLRNWRAQVVAYGPLVLEKFVGDYGANGMTS